MKIIRLIAYILLCSSGILKAQDPQFSQYYASPLYLNPAFTGANAGHRLAMNYRNQWPTAASNSFVSYVASYDYNWSKLNSGLGFFAIQDRAGTSALTYRNFGGLYSYEARLTKEWALRSGFHVSYTQKNIDFSRLIFNDQIYRSSSISADANNNINVDYLDYNVGALLYNEKAFLGLAVHHLTEPNESFIAQESSLPMKISIHGGYTFKLKDRSVNKSIMPSFNYKKQGNFDQLDFGIYYNHSALVLGVWYRGIPINIISNNKYANNDAIALLMGYSLENFPLRAAYSYDITTSGLFDKSGGSHEISVIYEFDIKNSSGRTSKYNKRPIPCAKF